MQRIFLMCLALVAVALAVPMLHAAPLHAAGLHALTFSPLMLVGSLGLGVDYRPKLIETILSGLKPNAAQPEAIPDTLYDTQTYVAAGSAALTFFNALPAVADLTLTNMQLAGALPNPVYFEIQKIFFDILSATTTAATQVGAVSDVDQILKVGRGIATFTLSDKQYGPYPLTFFGGSGGANGVIASAIATPGSIQSGSVRDNGGFPMNGALTIPPQVAFNWKLNWVAATAITADTKVRVTMLGIKYRRVS
jgi:hypothetical protein